MSDNNNSKHALRAIALCLTVAGAFALPSAGAQQAEPLTSQDGAVVVKDAQSGKLRAATPEEHNALKSAPGQAKKQMLRMAPKPTMNKYHGSGAAGASSGPAVSSVPSQARIVRRAAAGSRRPPGDRGPQRRHPLTW